MGTVLSRQSADVSELEQKLGRGLRVLRGPQWKWDNQDGGEGHLGMVRQLEGSDEVLVRWDTGSLGNYSVRGSFDLRIYDTAPCYGVHLFFTCDGCGDGPIQGLRWRCTLCDNYDLCSACYHGDAHDLSHPFDCYISSKIQNPVNIEIRTPTLPARQDSRKVDLVGALPGATVVRGADWNPDLQDGGEGQTGTIIDLDDLYGAMRGCVKVHWHATNEVNSCRMSRKADLKVVQPSPSRTSVYIEHLPALDFAHQSTIIDHLRSVADSLLEEESDCEYYDNDYEYDDDDEEEGNNAEAETETETEDRSLEQASENVPPASANDDEETPEQAGLSLSHFNPGEFVKLTDSLSKIKKLQISPRTEWTKKIKKVLGCVGKVLDGVDERGYLPVNFCRITALLNPRLLTPAEAPAVEKFLYDYVRLRSTSFLRSVHWKHGSEYNSYYENICGKFGRVVGFTKFNLEVLILGEKYTLNPLAVNRCEPEPDMLTLGDVVRVLQDAETVKMLQHDHGDDDVIKFLGKTGRVVYLDPNNDAVLRIEGQFARFNPAVLTRVQSAAQAEPFEKEETIKLPVPKSGEVTSTCKFIEVYEKAYELRNPLAQSDTEPESGAEDESRVTRPARSDASASTSGNVAASEHKGPSVVYVNQRSFSRSVSGVAESDEVSQLKAKLRYLEDQVTCKVCISKRKEVAFQCGHVACQSCAKRLEQCHICRANIEIRTQLF